jgi:dihydroorotase
MHQFDGLELPASADFHVHLREGDVMEAVTSTIRQGGVDTVYVWCGVCGVCVVCGVV